MNDANEARPRKSRATSRAERYLPGKVHYKFITIRDPATSPLSWRDALVFSFLAHRARAGKGCSRREVERATGLKRESLAPVISALAVGGLAEERDGRLHALRPADDALFHARKGDAGHWSDRYAYFRFHPCRGLMPAHALVYSRLLAMDEGPVSRSLLAGRLGMDRQTVARAFEVLASKGMLTIRDFATGEGYGRFRLPEPTPEVRGAPTDSGGFAADLPSWGLILSRSCPLDELTIRVETPLQRLLVERALAFAVELEQAADAAPDGLVLDRCESVATTTGRDFPRKALADTLEHQAIVADGKEGHRGPAPAAAGGGIRAARRGRS